MNTEHFNLTYQRQLIKFSSKPVSMVGGCIGFRRQGFGSRGAAGVATAPMLDRASSKTDPPPAKAEPISDAGSISVITHLRKGKKHCTAAV